MTAEIFVERQHTRMNWTHGPLLGLLSFALALFCLELIKFSGQSTPLWLTPLWLPTALMTIVVFRNPLKQQWLLLSSCVLGIVCASALVSASSATTFIFPLINFAQATIGGLLLRWLLDPQQPLGSLYSWSKMMVAVGLITPIFGGLLASCVHHDPATQVHFFNTWVISEVIGILALGPVALLWQPDCLKRLLQQKILVETLLTMFATLVMCWLTLRYMPWPFTFVIVILFFSAVRLGRFEAFVTYLITISMITLILALQLIPSTVSNAWELISAPWVPFLLALLPSHMMTLVMHSFREEQKHISESEVRFRHAMEYSVIGMALVSPSGQWLQVNKALCKLFGYSSQELCSLTVQQLTHPDDLHASQQQLYALLTGKIENYSLEKRYLRKDGQIVWALLAVSLVRDSEQQPLYFISQIEDVTELKQTEKVNQRLMERITLANEAAGIGVWEWDLQSDMMSWDKRMFQIYHLPGNSQATYQIWASSLHPADQQAAIAAFDNSIKNLTPVDIEFRIETVMGIRHIRSQSSLVLDEAGNARRMLGINQDVTALRQLTDALYQEKERMHITLDALNEGVLSTDKEMRVTFMNPVAEQMSGWLQQHAAGKPISDILRITHGSEGPEREIRLPADLSQEKRVDNLEEDLVLHNRRAEQFAIQYSLSPLKTLEGNYIGSVMVIQDVSKSREMMKHLSYSASHDMLTQLPNRVSFEHQLKQLLQLTGEPALEHVLVFIDLDHFKAVNDSAGHAAGDALLREISSVMLHQLRGSDFLARLGGDEFGVLLQDCSLEKAKEVTSRLVNTVNQHLFLWEGQLHHIGASAGLTLINRGNHNPSEIMVQADLACYNAKHNGRGQISVYESHLLKHLKPMLNQAENAQILAQQSLHLQVWAAAPPGRPQAVSFWLAELLLFTAEGHEIDETSFRAGLQDSELSVALDRKLIAEFFQHYAQGMVSKGLTLVLPLSTFGLRDDRFINDLLAQIIRFGVPENILWFSVNAEILATDDGRLQHAITRLRSAGCRIVLRDFGYNLDAFNQLPEEGIDYLLLNPEPIANVHCNLMDETIVSIIHGHAQRLGIATIAGPVEQPMALSTLSTMGIEIVWGNAIARCQPLATLLADSYFTIK